MFKSHHKSKIYLAYLADVTRKEQIEASDWFNRGWALRELLAPHSMHFLDAQWNVLGSRMDLAVSIQRVTKIKQQYLLDFLRHRSNLSVAARLSWASSRRTGREEYLAHCLFGLLDVQIDVRYGEGHGKAFRRLQKAVIADSQDEFIFAWKANDSLGSYGLLAPSVTCFKAASDIYLRPEKYLPRGSYDILRWSAHKLSMSTSTRSIANGSALSATSCSIAK